MIYTPPMTDIIPIAMSAQPAVYRAELILSIAANYSHNEIIGQSSGRTEHHCKLHVLISAEIREHKLAGQTLLLA